MLNVLWFIFIFVEIAVTIFTYYYLKREYAKALEDYYRNQFEIRRYFNIKKNEARKSIVQMNITDYIDTQEINEQLESVQFEFAKEGNHIVTERISKSKIHIGRDSRNDIIIKDRTVSKQQCIIIKRDGRFLLKNLSDRNATRVNGEVVSRKREIKYGDFIEIGKISFRFNNILEA